MPRLTPAQEAEVQKMAEARRAASRDTVNHPPHYQGNGIECIEALAAIGVAEHFCIGNTIKYLWRLGRKDDALQDARKAQWYLNKLVELLEAKAQ